MIIYPAIDLRGGRVVRLKEGDPNQQKVFSDDPVSMAQRWIDEGAAWIHMVNLDGSFADANDNEHILEYASKLGTPIQFGGGMRTLDDIARALNRGAARVVLGTIAIKNPEIVVEALEKWGAEKLCIGLDARDGKIATHGWQQTADITPVELGRQMAAVGLRHALFTDVSRDGMLGGGNIDGTINLGRETGLQIIASGGVSTAEDVQQLARSGYVAGAVIGMALYEGKITLKEAINAARVENAG